MRQQRQWIIARWVVLLTLFFSVIACGQPIRVDPGNPVRPAIALVLPGSKDDHSWSAAAYLALQSEAVLGAKTAVAENVADAEVAGVLQAYIAQGFRIIIAHSYSYQDAVFALAEANPAVNFAWAGGIGRTAHNVADYDQPFYQAAYLVGILAGAMSSAGKLGALYGFDIPVCHAMGEAFHAGAMTVNPRSTLIVSEIGDWTDVAKATAAGVAQAEQQGVDFWIACGEGPTLGSIAAAQATGGWATGYASDMTAVAPDVVLVSIVWQMAPLFATISQATAQDRFQGTFYRFGFKEDGVTIAFNPALQQRIPKAAQQALALAQKAIQQGTLQIPYIPR